jgi:hypothetical protein
MYGRNTVRKNRVAGPGFHINCRFDQFTIAQMRGRGGVKTTNPYLPASTHSEIYDVKEQEILIAERASGGMFHDGYTHCYSALNGYPVPAEVQTPQELKQYIFNRVKFVGIAVTEQKSDDRLIENGLVAQVGGVVTLLNNGTEPIHPCDKIMLDINFSKGRSNITREKGIPREKVRIAVTPAKDEDYIIERAMKTCNKSSDDAASPEDIASLKTAAQDAKKAFDEAPDDPADEKARLKGVYRAAVQAYKKAMSGKRDCTMSKTDMRDFIQAYRHQHELCIGKSLSFANVGERFEILLQPRSTI